MYNGKFEPCFKLLGSKTTLMLAVKNGKRMPRLILKYSPSGLASRTLKASSLSWEMDLLIIFQTCRRKRSALVQTRRTMGGDLVRSASPSNVLNVVPGTEGMSHDTLNATPSGGVGGEAFNFNPPESIARPQPEAAANIAASGTGESNEQPLQPQRPETRLQENQAIDSAFKIIIDDFSQVQRQVKELQRQRKESQRQSGMSAT